MRDFFSFGVGSSPFFYGLQGLSFIVSVWPLFLSTTRNGSQDVVHGCFHQIGLSEKQAFEVSGQGNERIFHIDFEGQSAVLGFIVLRSIIVFTEARFGLRGQNAIQRNQHKMGK